MSTLLYFALKIPHLPELCLCFLNSVIPPHFVTVSLSCAVVQKVPPGRKPRVIVVLYLIYFLSLTRFKVL